MCLSDKMFLSRKRIHGWSITNYTKYSFIEKGIKNLHKKPTTMIKSWSDLL
jgi:hypothetical protein